MEITVVPSGFLGVNTLFVPLGAAGAADGLTPVLAVDPGDPSCAEELARRKMRPVAVALTHGHFDHVLGLGALAAAFPGVPVAVHPADAGLFGASMPDAVRRQLLSLGVGREMVSSLADMPAAGVMLGEGVTLDALSRGDAGEKAALAGWKTLHTPGHTPGSVCFYNEALALLISGDTMFYGTCGRTDLPGGNDAQMLASLRRLSRLPGSTEVFPGHERWGFTLAENPLGL